MRYANISTGNLHGDRGGNALPKHMNGKIKHNTNPGQAGHTQTSIPHVQNYIHHYSELHREFGYVPLVHNRLDQPQMTEQSKVTDQSHSTREGAR